MKRWYLDIRFDRLDAGGLQVESTDDKRAQVHAPHTLVNRIKPQRFMCASVQSGFER